MLSLKILFLLVIFFGALPISATGDCKNKQLSRDGVKKMFGKVNACYVGQKCYGKLNKEIKCPIEEGYECFEKGSLRVQVKYNSSDYIESMFVNGSSNSEVPRIAFKLVYGNSLSESDWKNFWKSFKRVEHIGEQGVSEQYSDECLTIKRTTVNMTASVPHEILIITWKK